MYNGKIEKDKLHETLTDLCEDENNLITLLLHTLLPLILSTLMENSCYKLSIMNEDTKT